MKKYKKFLIALAIPTLIYFIWGCFGFAGAWIPGRYDAEKMQYKVFWGVLGNQSELKCYEGMCRIKGYTPFKRHGLIDTTGKVIIPFRYKSVDNPQPKNHNLILAQNLNEKVGAVNLKNEIIIPFEYDMATMPKGRIWNGLISSPQSIVMKMQDTFALFDINGKQILPPEYSRIILPYQAWDTITKKWEYVRSPFFIADKGNHCYFVLENGEKIKQDFISTGIFLTGKNLRIEGIKMENLNKDLWTINKIEENASDRFQKRITINDQSNLPVWYGLFDAEGKEILPLEYEEIRKEFIYTKARKSRREGIYDIENKKWIVPCRYKEAAYIAHDFPMHQAVLDNNKADYYDYSGTMILSSKVDTAYFERLENKTTLIFYKNRKKYKLYFDDNKQKFVWNKL